MIISDRFDGDNLEIADYQHDVYFEALGILIKKSVRFYLDHAHPIQLHDEITHYLNRIKFYDHRPFQLFHDLIAGYYRYLHCVQFPLPFKEIKQPPQTKEEWQEHWLDYVDREIDRLNYLEIKMNIVFLLLLYNTDYGYTLENWLALTLTDHYLWKSKEKNGKGVNLLGKAYEGIRKENEEKPHLYRPDIIKLISDNKELLEKRIDD